MSGDYSFKLLFVLSALFPGVLLNLYTYNFEENVVGQCRRESFAFEANEKKCMQYYEKDDESEYLVESYLELDEYEITKTQKPFECIRQKLHGPSVDIVESTQEYQKLKLHCDVQECVNCDPLNPYRTIDGTCNNLLRVKWGSIDTCMNRIFPAYYEGVSGFRRSVCRIPLPNARFLGMNLFTDKDKLSQDVNTIFLLLSEFISHDIVQSSKSSVNGKEIPCCSKRFRRHPECASIQVPPNDPFYPKYNITCLNVVRIAPCRTCRTGKREALNRVTSFLDLSLVYGLTEREAKQLRKNDGTGKLWVQETEEGDLLPPDFWKGDTCGFQKNHEYCFKAGDGRVNQQTPLSSLQTIFVREHNRIAENLKQLNPHWHDEKLYQETRKIVIAEYQVIVFKEVLPVYLEPELISSYNLAVSNGWTVYNPSVNPSVINEFAFASYRLHTLLPTIITRLGSYKGKKKFTEYFNQTAVPIYRGEMDNLIKGMCLTEMGLYDTGFSPDPVETIVKNKVVPLLDFISVDIQRGRDGGIPPYVDVIRYLSGGTINIQTFDDLEEMFKPEDVKQLKSLYCHVRDIDYYVGMHFEGPGKDTVLVGSNAKITAKQFRNLKFGDRYYFEHSGNFNKAQLRSLKDVTFSKILCDNTKFQYMQQNAMKLSSTRNPMKSCQEIPSLNLNLWKSYAPLF